MYQKKLLTILVLLVQLTYVMKINQKNYPQVYLEECKYKAKKPNTPRSIDTELELDSESDVGSDLESNTTTEN